MFSYKIYKELCCRANSWKCHARSSTPRSDFLQHFGTSDSAPGGQPEAREVIKYGLLPGQLWARLLPGEEMTHARREAGPHAPAAFSRRHPTKSPEGCWAPSLSWVSGPRMPRPALHTGVLHCPGSDQSGAQAIVDVAATNKGFIGQLQS